MRSRLFFLSLLLAVTALTVSAEEKEAKKTPWKMSGQLEEACSCNAACPCWFGSSPTHSQCNGGFAVFIDKGSYGSVPLDGLGAAFMGANKENTTMMESMGDWDFVTLYVDEKANPEQRKALVAIMQQTSPPAAPAERTHIVYVPITRTIVGADHVVKIGDVGGFTAHLMQGGMGGTPKITNPPGADPIHKEYQQGVTSKQTYTGDGKKWDWSNSNYMYGTFSTDSDEYAKFNAAMTQEMEKKKGM
ncbi:MAG TPA: DUF1326 domain-containing protein [Thermoanaerobaculia bacterium]|jgi:hypothetical protein